MKSGISNWRTREVHDLAIERHGLVNWQELRGLGLSPATVHDWCASGRLVRLAPQVYLVPALLDDRSHLAAVVLGAPAAVASHRAAARLGALDGIDVDLLEVTIPHGARLGSAVVHRSADLAAFEVITIDGIRCTDPTRTLCDLGAVVDVDVLERATESALRRRDTSVPRLRWRSGQLARPGRRGPAALRQVLDRRPNRSAATASDAETLFLQCVRAAGLPEPERQYPVHLPNGSVVRLDFAWPALRLWVEVDSWKHHSGRDAWHRDRRRQNQVVITLSWTPLRFTWDDIIHRPEDVRAALRSAA